jgi:hypothetical protein
LTTSTLQGVNPTSRIRGRFGFSSGKNPGF